MAKAVKAKTHKGLKKVLNVRQSGSITKCNSVGQHKTGKKPTVANRKKRAGSEVSQTDLRRFKEVL